MDQQEVFQRSLLHPNDLELLRLLAGPFLLLARRQITELFPKESRRNVNYRLQRMIENGYITKRIFPVSYSSPRIPLYLLGPKSAEALGLEPSSPQFTSQRRRALQLRDGAIPHFFMVTSVHIKFLMASQTVPDFELLSWIDQHDPIWGNLNSYGFPLRPDGYAEFRVGECFI